MILPLVLYPDPRLKAVAKQVTLFDGALRALVADMFETCNAHAGCGLAANQVGSALDVMVINLTGVTQVSSFDDGRLGPRVPEEYLRFALCNAKVTPNPDSPRVKVAEGCLSCPGTTARVPRRDAINVSGFDNFGTPLSFWCSGWMARVIQHEADHLAGFTLLNPRF